MNLPGSFAVAVHRASAFKGRILFHLGELRHVDPAYWLATLRLAIAAAAIAALLLHLLRSRRRRGWDRGDLPVALLVLGGAGALVPAGWPSIATSLGAVLLAAAAVLAGRAAPARLLAPAAASRRRRFDTATALVAPVLLVLCAAGLVAGSLVRARHFTERSLVIEQMLARRSDPWPRGTGHVPLGLLGAAARDKAYVEPGGSFSPAVGTFGLSIWVRDARGGLVATSDGLPLASLRHGYRIDRRGRPELDVRTPYYAARWTIDAPRSAMLRLVNLRPAEFALELALRSVGPAGGPLRDLRAGGDRVDVGSGWSIAPPPARLAAMGSELDSGWTRPARAIPHRVHNAAGWAYARFAPARTGTSVFGIAGPGAATTPTPAFPTADWPRADVPDRDFRAALDAQIATLMIGLVGVETRPGEPINYPLAWQRDGAYVLVALARSGRVALARRLAFFFARHDFFGGFGAEADAPGLTLWALGEIDAAGRDPAFAAAIWPDVVRKVAQIRRLASAAAPVHAAYSGPIVPAHRGDATLTLVAGPSRDGLIDGRMDFQRPIFFVNAAAHAGLDGAAVIARTLRREGEARRWRGERDRLGGAWRTAFAAAGYAADAANERTAIVGLWPADVADRAAYAALLDKRWSAARQADGRSRRRPLWTYFDLAEAHQWLRLDRPERAWAVLRELWREQPIPGLYTQWEGTGEENSFGLWRDVRGWTDPPNVTPHYWSAAEMLLLQLEMLAYADRGGIVIGAGVPRAWLAKPIGAAGIQTGKGPVSWRWDGRGVTVNLTPGLVGAPVRLGAGFPRDTPVRVTRSTAP